LNKLFITEKEIEDILLQSDISIQRKQVIFQLFMDNQKKELEKKDSENEIQLLKKDSENEMLKKDSENEILKKDSEIQLLILKKDSEIELLKKDKDHEIATLTRDLLQSKSACTSRGIFEYVLKGVQSELNLPGQFNAKMVCDALVKRKSCSSLFILKLTLCNRRCQREEVC
jgi:hypothetical protein